MNTRNPLVIGAGIVASITTIGGLFYFMDERYAHAADQDRKIEAVRGEIRSSIKSLERNQIEDRLYELELKSNDGVASSHERALIERYKRRLESLR